MLIISSGMQKSGSAYFYNIINELLVASGDGVDARAIKSDKSLDNIMKWHNNNIGALTMLKLVRLWKISRREGMFAVKTHARPSLSVIILNKMGMLRIVYCCRDPRDVVLSAIDHGKKIQDSGENHTFAKMVDFDTAVANVSSWLAVWKSYAAMPNVLVVKYEDMMQDPEMVTKKIEEYLNLSVSQEKRKEILWKFSRNNTEGDRTGMHFNKAQTFRYRTDMTEEQRAKCDDRFRSFLLAMGYESA